MKKKPAAKRPKTGKDMPVSELARMVAAGFTEVREDMNTGFAQLREEITGVREETNGRFSKVEQKIDSLHDSVHEFSYDHRKMKTRMENLELKVFGSIQEP